MHNFRPWSNAPKRAPAGVGPATPGAFAGTLGIPASADGAASANAIAASPAALHGIDPLRAIECTIVPERSEGQRAWIA